MNILQIQLCESSFGWRSAFYVHAAISGTLFCVWFYYYRNTPLKHSGMTDIELEKIHRNKGSVKEKEPVPVKVISNNFMARCIVITFFFWEIVWRKEKCGHYKGPNFVYNYTLIIGNYDEPSDVGGMDFGFWRAHDVPIHRSLRTYLFERGV